MEVNKTMSVFKKVTAATLSAAMMLSLSSCGKESTWAARINDYEVRAGIFIDYQMNAYYEAMDFLAEDQTEKELLKGTIEEKATKDWINDKATNSMQRFVAIEQKFAELGLSFENNEEQIAANYVKQMWDYYSSVYEGFGIGNQSLLDIYTNGYKENSLFDYYYGKNGEKEISEQEIIDYIYGNYAKINYIEMPLKDGEGNLLKSDGKAEMLEMANSYIDRAKNGENFDVLVAEFKKYYDDKVAAAAPSSETSNNDLNDALAIEGINTDSTDETADTTEEVVDNSTVIGKDTSNPNQAVVDKIFSGEVKFGDYFVVELDEVYYVVYFMDILAVEGYLDEVDSAARHAIKDEEFQAFIDELVAAQNVVKNDIAYKKYKAEKFLDV